MFDISEEVAAALGDGRPVVALESTILTHGLPRPHNWQVARDVEEAVREVGAVPATVAVLDGRVAVGVSMEQLERICSDDSFHKTGAADLAVYCAAEASAGTTVSATVYAAARAGIRLFATGGIGGVHRGDNLDESSDLWALSRWPVAVVSAGAKTVLDLAKTLERLESLGVLVLGYGCDELPAFYCETSGLRLEHRVDDPDEVAAVLRARWDGLGHGGVLVANPVPAAAALRSTDVETVIESALEDAAARGIFGKAVTPFLLAHLKAELGDRALMANRALAVHNAGLAARIAVSLAVE